MTDVVVVVPDDPLEGVVAVPDDVGNSTVIITESGPTGPTGPPGKNSTVPGPTGPPGMASTVPGPTGPPGLDSTVPGPTGPTGANSTVPGPTGPTGPPSIVPGPTGPTGSTGPTGAVSTVPGPTGPTGAVSTVPGPTGPTGAASTAPGPTGPPGPNAVSADAGNTAVLGSDSLIYVPLAFDEATADARYVNSEGDTIPGLIIIDRGPGAGIPLLRLKTNNGDMILSSDASSYLTFSGGVYIPTLAIGSLSFPSVGASIDFNGASLVNVGRLIGNGVIKAYTDYNAFPALADQGFAMRYANRSVSPDAVAFQAYKDGDPTENPFRISSHGYGWLRNALGNKPVLTLRVSPDQAVDAFVVEDAAGNPITRFDQVGGIWTASGMTTTGVIRVGGGLIDLWNDGRIYFAGQATHIGGTATEFYTNKPMRVSDPTDPMHAATKQYVDNATPTLPAEVAIIHDGLGAPTTGLGADGDYYLDKAGQTLYGPKGTNAYGGPTFEVHPPDPLSSSANSMLLGVKVKANAPALMVGMSFYVAAANTVIDGWILDLWDGDVSVSHTVANTVTQTGAWVSVSMPAFEMEVGKIYVASVMIPTGGQRTYKASWSAAQVNGPLTLCSTAEATPQGVYDNTYDGTAPTTAWQGYIPALSPVVQGIDPNVWPVAIRGVQGVSRGSAPHSLQIGDEALAMGIGSLALGVDSNGRGAQAWEVDQISLGTARHTVDVPGTLTVADVPVLERLAQLEARIHELEARLT